MLDFCAWCGKHVTPFMFNKLFVKDMRKSGFWFCSLRCYTEWHRRFYVKRKMLDLQFEGNPLENMPSQEEIPQQ